MRHSHTETDTPHLEVNLTPLIDLVFILLIFFLVTASFQSNTALDIQRPQAQTATLHTQNQHIMIEIDAKGALRLEQQAVSLSQLREQIQSLPQNAAPMQVMLVVDQKASTGLLVQVMDQVRLAGVQHIALAADVAP